MIARARSVFVKAAFWIPLAICSAVACTPSPMVADLSGVVAHAAAFFYLTLALCFAHFRRGPLLDPAIWLLAFGVLLELAQLLFVAGRSGELLDLVIDGAGIGLGCAVYAWLVDFKVAFA
ncbi:MAG: VanZ family protein [Gammaproteobacteria bacterium]|nr:VanZ family protein [Gammaproteobacteria bacterium]